MKGRKRWDHLNDFKRTADGQYIYSGKSYTADGFSRFKKKYIPLLLSAVLSTSASGFINAAGMNNSFYVILPFIAEVICLFVLTWNSVRLLWAKGVLREYIYSPVKNNVPASSFFVTVFAAIGLIGSLIFMLLHGFEGKPVQCVMYILLKIVSGVCSLLLYKVFKKTEWKEA